MQHGPLAPSGVAYTEKLEASPAPVVIPPTKIREIREVHESDDERRAKSHFEARKDDLGGGRIGRAGGG